MDHGSAGEAPSLTDQLRGAVERFAQAFGRPPRFAAAAPGRVNLIGEHTDYNAGFVLPMAIERRTVVVADRRDDRRVRLRSSAQPDEAEFSLDSEIAAGEPTWANYVRGVVAGYLSRGIDPGGFDALIESNVPGGGGLSSSAALEVSGATLIEALAGERLEPVDKALLCQWAEHEFAQMPCGIMDQFISTMAQAGHALLIDCRSHAVSPVAMDDPDVAVLIVNTNVPHKLVEGEYAKRRQQCETAAAALGVAALRDATLDQLTAAKASLNKTAWRRARHVITENERTVQAAEAMRAREWDAAGELMCQSHMSLRDDFEVSCPELDLLVELVLDQRHNDVFGTRMTGAGFGGCTVTLLRVDAAARVTADVTQRYHQRTGLTPTAFLTRPAAGAQQLAVEGT